MHGTSPMLFAWIVSLLVPPALLVHNLGFSRRRFGWVRSVLLSSGAMIAMIVGTTCAYDHHLNEELAAFDRNGDGFFTGAEISPEQEQAMFRVTNDLSRVFAPIAGSVFSIGYSTLFFGLVAGVQQTRRRSEGAA